MQAALGLGFLVGGAHLFVEAITATSRSLGVSPFLLSVFITPLATELPETFNSIIWLGEKKDTLALGNITGAMVLQSSLVPAIGIFFTPWVMGRQQLWAVGMALLAGALVWGVQVKKGRIPGAILILNGLFYGIYGLAVSL
ncbi:MAG: hypothetical protein KM310_10410 [Clostridiales bacterium]|nr:hypothetical protein [Clostridiales bacterium]